MSIHEKLRALADLAEHTPADMISVYESGASILVSNFVTAARWRETLNRHPELADVDVRLLQPMAVPV